MERVELLLVWFAAPAATLFPLVYAATAPWWRSSTGRALMTSSIALALLLDLSLLFHYWTPPSLAVAERVALVVYVLIWLGAWLMLFALVGEQVRKRRR